MVQAWGGTDSDVCRAVDVQRERLLQTYRTDPGRVEQDANIERSIAEGAYAKRQLFELIQNAADAMQVDAGSGRCEVILTDRCLYAANSGSPLSVTGVETLMATHRSGKRDDQIGRFGLGFKSVLAVTDSPKVLSRSGSLAFDRNRSAEELDRIVPQAPHFPACRLAWVVDAKKEAFGDPVLTGLMKWASSIVVLPLKAHGHILAKSLAEFPAEFLLFSSHVRRLDLEDRTATSGRSITLSAGDAGELILSNAGKKSVWIVNRARYAPSKAALEDGGYHAARESLEVAWAAPLQGAPVSLGAFWSYFPTQSGTTLSGIVNAPWKLAEDRETLLEGTFNRELLTQVLPGLVAGSVPLLYRPDRPGAVLDALPARGREWRNYADDVLNEPVIRAVGQGKCIPTLAGTLQTAKRAELHPEGVTPEEMELWASGCPDPENWAHTSLSSPERRSKLTRLLALHNRSAVELKAWVEHLVKEPDAERSAIAVQLVALLRKRLPADPDLAKARVLLLADGTLHACIRGQVFLPGGTPPPGALIIDEVLAGDRAVVKALAEQGIEVFDTAGELMNELTQPHIEWSRVWPSARKISAEEAERIFREALEEQLLTDLRVRVHSGKWQPPCLALLPGCIIPADGTRDQDHVVDHRYHQQDLELLERLGLTAAPRRLARAPEEPWRSRARQRARDGYREAKSPGGLPDEKIIIEEFLSTWPLEVLDRLSPQGRAALTTSVLSQMTGQEEWRVSRTDGKASAVLIPDPAWERLRRNGYLTTQVGIQPTGACLRWSEDCATQDGVEQPLPVVPETFEEGHADALGLRSDPGELRSDDWARLLRESGGWEERRRYLLYAWAAFCDQPAPRSLKVRRGPGHTEAAPTQCAVTSSAEVYESLTLANVPAVLLGADDAALLRERWGLATGEDMLTETLDYDAAGEPVPALDEYPPLRNLVDDEWAGLVLQRCSRLELQTATPGGADTRALVDRLEGTTLYTTAPQDRAVLAAIARHTGASFTPDRVLSLIETQRLNHLRQEILKESNVPAKLLLAIGPDDLRSTIPVAALGALEHAAGHPPTDLEIAKLSLAVHGYSVLEKHKKALAAKGLGQVVQWAGSRNARDWVRGLGFPIEYAGFSGETRAAELEVDGPAVLGPLHDYQARIADRVRDLLRPDTEMQRGLLSLPTGAGKTRVAVQALVQHMVSSPSDVRVVWLAETDELCEQATQTWAHVWRAAGTPGTSMTLSRLWQANRPNEREGHQVVVASLSKLLSILQANGGSLGEYAWLVRPAIIVVDEAHRSIGTMYTQVISALGGASRVVDIRTPLLGLTATPFRGFNEKETEQLAARYHRHLLDDGVFPGDDAYGYLQQHGVLARVRHIELQGAEITLSDTEKGQAKIGLLPSSAEKRLGLDRERNQAILEALLDLDEDQTALVFATSVENAEVLAALLTHHAMEARAISGESDAFARRRYVQEFRERKIRVLTNYNVFTEGFDVPKVDAVFITRPTFSPNVYQQMVGRGLRGPLNGGNPEVLIVNVADNITNYGETLAFHHFEHLWTGRPGHD